MHGSALTAGFINPSVVQKQNGYSADSAIQTNTALTRMNPISTVRPPKTLGFMHQTPSLRRANTSPRESSIASACTPLNTALSASNDPLSETGGAGNDPTNLVRSNRGDLVLKPLPGKGEPQSLVFLPGAETDPAQYLAMAQKLQEASPDSLWVGIAKYDMPVADINVLGTKMPLVSMEGYTNPIAVHQEAQHVVSAMRQAGLKDTKPFLAGHSLGGAFLHHVVKDAGEQYAGLIHLSSFLPRRLSNDHPARHLPTLTVNGDLDGLVNIMRIAEAYHHNVERAPDPLQNPVVVIEGANHGSFFEGPIPPFVAAHDLPAEVEHSVVQKKVADTITQFMDCHSKPDNGAAKTHLREKIDASGTLLAPLIDALKLEGSYHIKYPCSMASKADPQDCWVGSPWVEQVTPIVTGAAEDGIQISTRDEFNPSWIINLPLLTEPGKPTFHHPKVSPPETNAKGEPTGPIKIDTVSQAVYDAIDERMDTGITPNTAQRIRAKFPSRQAVQAAAGRKIKFDANNNGNIASKINQMAIDWALTNASSKARERYEKNGIPLVAGEDFDVHTGPDWIWSDFTKRLTTDETGKPHYVLDAAVMRAPTESKVRKIPFLPEKISEKVDDLIGGKHFTTLLSPAEAMRHIYQESLRTPQGTAATEATGAPAKDGSKNSSS